MAKKIPIALRKMKLSEKAKDEIKKVLAKPVAGNLTPKEMMDVNDEDIARLKAKSLYMPKGPVVESMCARCPFNQAGKGYAVNHPDFPAILQSVQLGFPFYCHETVILHPDTTMSFDPSVGEKVPDPPLQPHFKNCKGAVMLKRGEIEPPKIVPPFTCKRKKRK